MAPPGGAGSLSPVARLTARHDVTGFDCGVESLNTWLKRFALANQLNDSAQTFVAHKDNAIVGYYSLTAGSVQPERATARTARGLARHPIGVILLARLAVHQDEKGTGLGKALLKDALLRAAAAADTIGARAVLVHAIDHAARAFYEHFGFERSPVDDFELMLLMKDLRRLLR